MNKCAKCKEIMLEKNARIPEGISYNYYSCKNCSLQILDMKQLHNVVERCKC